MAHGFNKLAAVVAVLAASAASAAPLSLWVGQSELLGLQRRIVSLKVSDPAVLSVEKLKSGAELRATAPGRSHVEMRTRDGFVFEFDVNVTPRGTEVYSVNRNEPEHPGFSLEGYKAGDKPVAAKVDAAKATPKQQARRMLKGFLREV